VVALDKLHGPARPGSAFSAPLRHRPIPRSLAPRISTWCGFTQSQLMQATRTPNQACSRVIARTMVDAHAAGGATVTLSYRRWPLSSGALRPLRDSRHVGGPQCALGVADRGKNPLGNLRVGAPAKLNCDPPTTPFLHARRQLHILSPP